MIDVKKKYARTCTEFLNILEPLVQVFEKLIPEKFYGKTNVKSLTPNKYKIITQLKCKDLTSEKGGISGLLKELFGKLTYLSEAD